MKPLVLFDPEPRKNDYLTRYVFPAMVAYGADTGRPIKIADTEDICSFSNHTILCEAQHLDPKKIIKLKINENDLVSFDINDNTCLCNHYYQRWEASHIDLIFKYSGIMRRPQTNEISISHKFEYDAKPVMAWHNYWAEWSIYTDLRDSRKMVPCAYTPWDTSKEITTSFKPFEERRKTCLIRGGLHYLRYHLFLMLVKYGLADKNCGFDAGPYHQEAMRADMRFCPECCKAYNSPGGLTYKHYKSNQFVCNQRNKGWQDKHKKKNFMDIPNLHLWNNECLPSFYWLLDEWAQYHGGIDTDLVSSALNQPIVAVPEFERMMQECVFYGDFKWMNCINFPMRHWHAVREKTITLVPRRTRDQYYFPKAIEGEHYIAFADNFSDLHRLADITKEQYEHITEKCLGQYIAWIRSDKYTLNTNMLERMFKSIEALKCIDDQSYLDVLP